MIGQRYNPCMIKLGRQFCGMSQTQLAKVVGISKAALSLMESGDRTVTDEHAEAIAKAINRPVSFLRWEGTPVAPTTVYHRRKATTRMKAVDMSNAYINVMRHKAMRMMDGIKLRTKRSLHRIDFDGDRNPANAAKRLRAAWQVMPGPIPNMVDLLESAGVFIWLADGLPDAIDGLSVWPLGEDQSPPTIVLVSGRSADRTRLTLAHELGHLVLHHIPVEDAETEANQFAAEFLMPAEDIVGELKHMTLPKAGALKRKWKVSMQAIIRRSHDLECITSSVYRRLMTELSQKGYRRSEPVVIPAEQPKLLPQLIQQTASRIKSAAQRAEFLGELSEKVDAPMVSHLKVFG